jgi:hypothetical protein
MIINGPNRTLLKIRLFQMSRATNNKFNKIKRPQPPQVKSIKSSLVQFLNRDLFLALLPFIAMFAAYYPAWNGQPI